MQVPAHLREILARGIQAITNKAKLGGYAAQSFGYPAELGCVFSEFFGRTSMQAVHNAGEPADHLDRRVQFVLTGVKCI